MAVIADIANAVVTELNAGTFSQALTAVRAYLPQYDLAEMKDLHVTVVPKGVEIDVSSRTLAQHDYSMTLPFRSGWPAATCRRWTA